jgi:hypothetical protein
MRFAAFFLVWPVDRAVVYLPAFSLQNWTYQTERFFFVVGRRNSKNGALAITPSVADLTIGLTIGVRHQAPFSVAQCYSLLCNDF